MKEELKIVIVGEMQDDTNGCAVSVSGVDYDQSIKKVGKVEDEATVNEVISEALSYSLAKHVVKSKQDDKIAIKMLKENIQACLDDGEVAGENN